MMKILNLRSSVTFRSISSIQKNILVHHNLTKYFQDKIRISGPITVEEYMRQSLKTYYNSGKVFGSDGDFITSPEISQLYGEVSKLRHTLFYYLLIITVRFLISIKVRTYYFYAFKTNNFK